MKYCIVDLEATCDAFEDLRFCSEIIEIGAVMMEDGKEVGEYQTFVRPVYRPILTKFCIDLTSITQEQVAIADPITQVMPRFQHWLRGQAGDDYRKDILFCSWGAYDRNQIRKECGANRLEYPFSEEHLNIKDAFAEFYKIRPCGTNKALQRLGIKFEGRQHRGIDDARMITKILLRMMQDGYQPKGIHHGTNSATAGQKPPSHSGPARSAQRYGA